MKITKRQLKRIIKEEKAKLMEYGGRPYDPTVPSEQSKQLSAGMKTTVDDYITWAEENGHITPAASSVVASYIVEDPKREGSKVVIADAFGMKVSEITREVKRQQAEKAAIKESIRWMIREAMSDEPIRQIPGDSFSPNALKDQKRRFGDYSKKGANSYKTVITMSPEGDSVIVDGIETYIDDVPQQLEILSGFPMEGNDPDNLVFALEEMWRDGYVELAVSYEDGRWGW